MGGHPYWYFTKYRGDVGKSLHALRQQEFKAGRYNPVIPFIEFPITPDSPAPGAEHDSIEEAMEDGDAEGTRSILDIFQTSEVPYSEAIAASAHGGMELFCTTFPISSDELIQLLGTDKPSRDRVEAVLTPLQAEAANQFWDSIERGTCRHIVIYEDDKPTEIFFIGYSFD